MKLSEIKGDRAIDVIAEILEPIGVIMDDEQAKKIFDKKNTENKLKLISPVLKKYKNEVYSILATIEGVPVEEYIKSTSLFKIFSDFSDLLSDMASQSLFISAKATQEKKS